MSLFYRRHSSEPFTLHQYYSSSLSILDYLLYESKRALDHLLLKRRVGFREIESNYPKVQDLDSVGKVCCGLLVRRELVGDPPEVSPLPAYLVFVANVPGIAFGEV